MDMAEGGRRIEEIDVAKGICILLMVMGHSGIPHIKSSFIYAFHMPFFFLISGLTTNVYKPWRVFIQGKVKRLLLPFVFYYILHLPLYAYIYGTSIAEQFAKEWNTAIQGALWFIPVLFLAQVINRAVPKNCLVTWFSVVSFASVSSLLVYFGVALRWNLTVLGMATSFLLLGRIVALDRIRKMRRLFNVRVLFVGIIVSFLIVLFISTKYQLSMYYSEIEPLPILFSGALVGIMMILMISCLIGQKSDFLTRFFIYTGVNSFVFIGLSQPLLKIENLYLHDYVVLKYALLFCIIYFDIFEEFISTSRKFL